MDRQEIEREKYQKSYTDHNYKMGLSRMRSAEKCIRHIMSKEIIQSHLDVSTGRGEIVDYMRSKNIHSMGTDIVDSLLVPSKVIFAWSNSLPFEEDEFDLITCLDAMEHYLPEQTEEIVTELCRVAKKYVYFAISNLPSHHMGENLHINIKSYEKWFELLSKYGEVEWIYKKDNSISENFILKL